MARGLNRVMLIGHLGRDPELRYTAAGAPVTTFTLAVGRAQRGPDGSEATDWFRVVAWDALAETCAEHLRKGDRAYIDGRIQFRQYADRDGIERTATEVIVGALLMLGSPRDDDTDAKLATPGGEECTHADA